MVRRIFFQRPVPRYSLVADVAGFVGNRSAGRLIQDGYRVIAIDDLSTSLPLGPAREAGTCP